MTVDFNRRHLTPKFCRLYMWPGSFHFSKGAIGLQRQWQENHTFYLTVGLKGWGTYLQQRVQPSMVLEPFPLWLFPFQDSGLPEPLAVPPESSKASACPTRAASLQWHLGEGAQSVPSGPPLLCWSKVALQVKVFHLHGETEGAETQWTWGRQATQHVIGLLQW